MAAKNLLYRTFLGKGFCKEEANPEMIPKYSSARNECATCQNLYLQAVRGRRFFAEVVQSSGRILAAQNDRER